MLRIAGIFLASLLLNVLLFGKDLPNKDSLNQIRLDPTLADTTRLEALAKLIEFHYQNKLPDSAFFYGQQLSEEAKSVNDLHYEAEGQYFAASALHKQGVSAQAKPYYERALEISEQLGNRERMADIYTALGSIYSRQGNFDQAKEFLQRSIDLDFQLGDSLKSSAALLSIGRIFEAQGNAFKSLEYNQRALDLSIRAGNQANEAIARNNLANNYKALGDVSKSVEQYLNSRAIYEATDNAYGIVNALNNLSVLLIENREFENVTDYLKQASKISEERELVQGQAMTYANKAFFHTAQNEFKEGLEELFLAAQLIEQHELESMKPFINGELGNILMILERFDEAEKYLIQGLEDSKRLGMKRDQFFINLILSQLYKEKGNLRLAMDYATKGYKGTQGIQAIRLQVNYADHLVALHKALGNNKEALRMYEIQVALKDSIYNEENTRSLIKQEYRYAYTQQAYQDSLNNVVALNLEKEKSSRQKIFSFSLLGVLAIILLFGWLLWNRLQVIRQQKQIIEEEKAKSDLANAKLREIDDFKSRFFTNISHEFRTPLTVIGGMVGQIRNNPDKWLQRGSDLIESNVQNLLKLINQILDLRKLESGSLSLNYIQDDVASFLKTQTLAFLSLGEQKNVKITFQSAMPSLVMDFDPEKLLLILTNLISNAVKFTPEGGRVEVKVHKTPANQFLLEVEDTGIGIPPEKLPFIFDRFYQVDGSHSRSGEGTGIGLSLTQELVKYMDGSIEVESHVGKGSRFSVQLPIRNQADIQPAKIEEKAAIRPVLAPLIESRQVPATPNQELPELLIIEDNPDVITYLTACLEDSYRLLLARDGEEGVALALEYVPDLIISDVMMPKMDGYQVCNILKSDERTSHIPIVLLTAKADRDSRLEGLQKGADAYLTKPFDQDELFIRLEKLLELRKNLQARYVDSASAIPEKEAAFELEDAFIQKIRNTILERIDDSSFRNEDLCKSLGVSRTQLHKKIKALTAKSSSHFIRSIRLEKAKEFLKKPELRITEVAYAVGFSDPSYFTRVFTKEFGSSPKEWRELNHS